MVWEKIQETSGWEPLETSGWSEIPREESIGVPYTPKTFEEQETYSERLKKIYDGAAKVELERKKGMAGKDAPQIESSMTGFLQGLTLVDAPILQDNFAAQAFPGWYRAGYAVGAVISGPAIMRMLPAGAAAATAKSAPKAGLLWGSIKTVADLPRILGSDETPIEKAKAVAIDWGTSVAGATALFYATEKGAKVLQWSLAKLGGLRPVKTAGQWLATRTSNSKMIKVADDLLHVKPIDGKSIVDTADFIARIDNNPEILPPYKNAAKALVGADDLDLDRLYMSIVEQSRSKSVMMSTLKQMVGKLPRKEFQRAGKNLVKEIDSSIDDIMTGVINNTAEIKGNLRYSGKGTLNLFTGYISERNPSADGVFSSFMTNMVDTITPQVKGEVNHGAISKVVYTEANNLSRALKMSGFSPAKLSSQVADDIQLARSLRNIDERDIAKIISSRMEEQLSAVGKVKEHSGLRALWNLTLRRAGEVLKDFGPESQSVGDDLQSISMLTEQRSAKVNAVLEKALNNLTEKEINSFALVAEGKMRAVSPAQAQAVKVYRSLDKLLANQAKALKVQIKSPTGTQAFKELENHYPHIWDPDELRSLAKRADFLQRLVDTGQAKNLGEAKKIIDVYLKGVSTGKAPSLEYHRALDIPGWKSDPREVLPTYFYNTMKRLETIKRFGQGNEILDAKLLQIEERAGKGAADFVRQTVEGSYKNEVSSMFSPVSGLLRGVRNYQTTTKLDLAAVNNSMQGVNAVLAADTASGYNALLKYKGGEAYRFAQQSGAISQNIMQSAMEMKTGGSGKMVTTALKMYGFTATENNNRVFSASVGKIYALRMSSRLAANPQDQLAIRALKELGVNPLSVLKAGSLNENEILRAGYNLSKVTQFGREVTDLPLFWSTPEGKVLTQFKTFSYNQTIFLYNKIVGEAKQGNLVPLVKFLTYYGATGELVGDIRSCITGVQRESNMFKRYIQNITYAGGLGLLGDSFSNMSYGRESALLESVAGPTVGDASAAFYNLTELAKLNWKPLSKQLIQQVPLLKHPAKRVLFPKK